MADFFQRLVERSLGSLGASQVVQPILPSRFENRVRQPTAAMNLADLEEDIPVEEANPASNISQDSTVQQAQLAPFGESKLVRSPVEHSEISPRPMTSDVGHKKYPEQPEYAMGLRENNQETLPAARDRQYPLDPRNINPSDVTINATERVETGITHLAQSEKIALRKPGNGEDELIEKSPPNREHLAPSPNTIVGHEPPRSILSRQSARIGKSLTGHHESELKDAPIDMEATPANTVEIKHSVPLEDGRVSAKTPVLTTSLSQVPSDSALRPNTSPAGERLDSIALETPDHQVRPMAPRSHEKEGLTVEDIPIAIREPKQPVYPPLPTSEAFEARLGENEIAPKPQTIHVTIGRIEVKAVMPPQPPTAKRSEPPKPRISLEAYLKQQRKG